MKTENTLTLPDGRKLAYAEFGKPEGYPVFYFHATPSSRLEPLFVGNDLISQFGLHVICPDRPGMGGSDFQYQRSFSDWPEDIIFLADTVGLNKFSVLGISGGSGYAAVCAAKIPERITKVVIASGAWRIDSKARKRIGSPLNIMWQVAAYAPIFLPFILKMMTKIMSQPSKGDADKTSTPPNKIMPATDHAVMAQPGRIDINRQVLNETMKQGSKGPVWDMRLYVREWDFDLAEIQIPLMLFHGEQDRNYPFALVQRVADNLPYTQLISYPEEGHISTYTNHFDEIAKTLIGEQL